MFQREKQSMKRSKESYIRGIVKMRENLDLQIQYSSFFLPIDQTKKMYIKMEISLKNGKSGRM